MGLHVCSTFVKSGKFEVRGTIRNKDDPEKIKFLTQSLGQEVLAKVELFEADLLDGESIRKAI